MTCAFYRESELSMKRGRPKGTCIRLLNNPNRFEFAAWLSLTQQGMKPYPAAYLVTFLMSGGPITIESLDAAVLKSTTTPRLAAAIVIGQADRLRSNAELAIKRADDLEHARLTYSAGLIARADLLESSMKIVLVLDVGRIAIAILLFLELIK